MPDEQPTEDRARPGDEPITKLAEDRLKLGSYIFGLLRTMERAETPFTVGVFGSWGSGKTSLLNLLEDAAQVLAALSEQVREALEAQIAGVRT